MIVKLMASMAPIRHRSSLGTFTESLHAKHAFGVLLRETICERSRAMREERHPALGSCNYPP